jgi:hypothetical protein
MPRNYEPPICVIDMNIKLGCGCVWSQERKRYIKYCRQHLNNVVAENLQKQKQLMERIIQQEAL